QQRYVDAGGRPVTIVHGSSRAVTRIDREGMPVAVLLHEADGLDDPRLVAAVDAATRLSAVNARLQAEMRARVAEANESRRRIVDAAVDERRRLERRLSDGVLGRLDHVGQALAGARAFGAAVDAATVDRAAEQLAAARADLVHLARGIHPGRLSEQGLTARLQALAAT